MMRFPTLVLLALVLANLFSCQKDQFEPLPIERSEYQETEQHIHVEGVEIVDGLRVLQKTHASAASEFRDRLSEINLTNSTDELEVTNIIVTPDGQGGYSFVGLIDAFDANLYKLVSRTNSLGEVYESGVLEIQVDHAFINSARDGIMDGGTFTVRAITIDQFTQRRDGDVNTGDDCWRMVFGNPSGGGGQHGNPVGTEGGTSAPPNGGYPPGYSPTEQWQNDGCTYDWFTVCGCEPMHLGGRQNSLCVCTRSDVLYAYITCPLVGKDKQTTALEEGNIINRNEYWDCVSSLIDYGLITTSDLLQQRLMDCEGLGEVYDIDNNPDLSHLDPEFCTSWRDYKDNCLATEPFREVINTWAELLFQNPSAFSHIVSNDPSCNGGELAELLLEFPGLDLSVDEMITLLSHPEFIGPLHEMLNVSLSENSLIPIVHQLLETTGHQTDVTPELIDDIRMLLSDTAHSPQDEDREIAAIESILTILNELDENFTVQFIREFISEVDDFFDDTANNENELYDFLIENNINPVAISIHDVIDEEDEIEQDWSTNWQYFTPGNMWAIGGPIRTELRSDYPGRLTRIARLFTCRVMGIGFESAALESLGIPHYGGVLPRGTGYTRRPDGYKEVGVLDADGIFPTVHMQPIIVEIKGFFSTTPGAKFDYSRNWGQFIQYLDYLQTESHRSDETALHALYLVLPGRVQVTSRLIEEANLRNVPLYLSGTLQDENDPANMKLSRPVWLNADEIDKSGHLFAWMGDWIFTKTFHQKLFNYDETSFQNHLNNAADEFELSHLIGNAPEECDPEDEVYED